ncbi:MAG: glycosyltransferase [Gammaproteobacteria bacterium]|nr:glycosyltransferase [Gammaproteobacteria bacterium]
MTKPKISVITAVYNNEKNIESCIRSVLSQDYENIEYIVIDGNSSDSTLAKIRNWSSKIDSIISEPDSGIYDALNKGIKASTGDIIAFLHSDDIYENNLVLSKVANAFLQNNSDSVYGDLVYISNNNSSRVLRKWKSGSYSKRKLLFGWMPPHPSLFIKRSVYEKYGVFNTSLQIAADYDIILRFFGKHSITSTYIDRTLVKMRVGGISNRSLKSIIQKTKEDLKAIKRNNVGNPTTILFKNLQKIPQFF